MCLTLDGDPIPCLLGHVEGEDGGGQRGPVLVPCHHIELVHAAHLQRGDLDDGGSRVQLLVIIIIIIMIIDNHYDVIWSFPFRVHGAYIKLFLLLYFPFKL